MQPRYPVPQTAKGGAPAQQQKWAFTTMAQPYTAASTAASATAAKPKSKSAGPSKRVAAPQPQPAQSPEEPATAGDAQPARSAGWTPEEVAEAKANSQEWFDAPLNASGSRRVRVTTFGKGLCEVAPCGSLVAPG